MRLLDAFAAGSQDMTLSAVAAAAGMPPSKAHRYLVSLIRAGFVEQMAGSSRYRLGRGALALGLAALRHINVVEIAGPILKELRDSTGLTVSMAAWANHGPTVVRVVETANPMVVTARVGTVLPLLSSANGHLYLAHLPRSETAELLKQELKAARKHAAAANGERRGELPGTPEEIIERAKREYITRNFEMSTIGLTSLAAPVFDARGELACTIALIGPVGHLDMSLDGPMAEAVRRASLELSARIGGSAPRD